MDLIAGETTTQIKRGGFTGNGGTNRAIPHGLGRQPDTVFLWSSGGDVLGWYTTARYTYVTDTPATGYVDVTVSDATNFYVSGAGNVNTRYYNWVAIG